MQIADLFCGIGGVAEATRESSADTRTANAPRASVVAAIDIDRRIENIYSANHGVVPTVLAIESIQKVPDADVWWLSPPCQPYTRRGRGLAEDDPRSLGLARIIELLPSARPDAVMLENVPSFSGSQHHRSIESMLRGLGYAVCSDILCPTQWGIPMKRKRFYLRARRDRVPVEPIQIRGVQIKEGDVSLQSYIEEAAWDDESLRVTDSERERYATARSQLDVDDAQAIAACFTSAYGKSPVRSGSYLFSHKRDLLRRFSPSEVARLMGYREGFWWPEGTTPRIQYQLLGNALCVPVVRALLLSMATG